MALTALEIKDKTFTKRRNSNGNSWCKRKKMSGLY